LGLMQLCSQPDITGRQFCAFLHGLGQNRPIDARHKFVKNRDPVKRIWPWSFATGTLPRRASASISLAPDATLAFMVDTDD
ncbi:hypothetical protein, partial [Burkholderia ubonensis]|uniref:hypothetical protein n=1 Tax=Burkholderia ubonensis TaxID=101571 RepID=UPI001C895954